ncbi:DUF1330 domain-containing protein [Microbacterium sp. NPDC089695]|uniref:DUF1330 domain-containing protein n=1 Tax=Microbacterium sp. NPDC089695 TaxID=3364198 RepID=UPI00382626A3
MTAYIVFQRERTDDQEALDRYAARADATFDGHDVQALVDYGAYEVLEGPPVEGVVVLAFPDRAAAKAWYSGDAYQEVVKDRFRGATYRAVLVDGVEDAGVEDAGVEDAGA